jgi:hypothetical protein
MPQNDVDVERAIEGMAELLVHTVLDDTSALTKLNGWSQRTDYVNTFNIYALSVAGVTEEELQILSEEATAEYEDPRHALFYSCLTSLNQAALMRAYQKMSPFYGTASPNVPTVTL